jgi:hypothetical protein
MTPAHRSHFIDANSSMVALIDRYPAGCESDFDDGPEELERQSAELRLTFEHI